jgi:hypothetical protein
VLAKRHRPRNAKYFSFSIDTNPTQSIVPNEPKVQILPFPRREVICRIAREIAICKPIDAATKLENALRYRRRQLGA